MENERVLLVDRKYFQPVLNPDVYPGSMPPAGQVAKAEKLRSEGNKAFLNREYWEALQLFSKAILYNPFDNFLYSNRSACWANVGRHVEALDDAFMCVTLDPLFVKGWGRKGLAEFYLGRLADATQSYETGLSIDPDHQVLTDELKELKKRPRRPTHMLLFAPRFLDLELLFEQLEDPDGLTAAYVASHEQLLNMQLEYLGQALHLDAASIGELPELGVVFDQATFACGQLLSCAPAAVSRLKVASYLVRGLGCVLRIGWSVNHGVAKFAANALCDLAVCGDADERMRRMACQLLYGGMSLWLQDNRAAQASVYHQQHREVEEVCGCSCMRPKLSAACWLSRLFNKVPKEWVLDEFVKFPDMEMLVIWLTVAVRDSHANPVGLVCMLHLPAVAKRIFENCDFEVDLFQVEPRPSGAAAGAAAVPWTEREVEPLEPGGAPSVEDAAGSNDNQVQGLFVEAVQRIHSAPAGSMQYDGLPSLLGTTVAAKDLPSSSGHAAAERGGGGRTPYHRRDSMETNADPEEMHDAQDFLEEDSANRPNQAQPGSGTSKSGAVSAPRVPKHSVGEWLMASVAYLVLFIDGDPFFSVQASKALLCMATASPEATESLLSLWLSLPLLRRVSEMACQHYASLQLLQHLAAAHPAARTAMRSLASAMAREPKPNQPPSVEESAASESQPARAAASASGGEAPEEGDERRKDKRPAEQQPDSGSGDEEVTRSISRKRLEGTGPQTRAEESSVASMDTGTTASSSNLIGGGGRGSVEADTAMSESSALLESRTTAEARVEQGTRPPASDNLPAGQPTTGADPAAPAGQPTIEAESAAPAGQPTPGAESATPAGQPTPGGEQALPTVPSWAEFYEEVHRLLFVPLDAAEVHSLERAEAKTAASRAYAQWPRISAAPAGKVASSESSSSSEEEDEQEEQEDDEDSEERGEGGAMEQDFELALESDVVALQALGIPPPTNSTEINHNSHDDSSSSGVRGGLKLAMPPRSGTENAPKQTVHVDTPRDDGFDWDTMWQESEREEMTLGAAGALGLSGGHRQRFSLDVQQETENALPDAAMSERGSRGPGMVLTLMNFEALVQRCRKLNNHKQGGVAPAKEEEAESRGGQATRANAPTRSRSQGDRELQASGSGDPREDRVPETQGAEESGEEGGEGGRLEWPFAHHVVTDVAQAWALLETVKCALTNLTSSLRAEARDGDGDDTGAARLGSGTGEAAAVRALEVQMAGLRARMDMPEKRMWLSRNLNRRHREDVLETADMLDPPLAFVECDRDSDQLTQLRTQLHDETGLAAPMITAEFEVRFKGESSVGTALMREWIDLVATEAYRAPKNHLLISYDGGVSFVPAPLAPYINPKWRQDYNMLGRLIGLALYHHVSLNIPFHPHICKLLFCSERPWPGWQPQDVAKLDADLYRNKMKWILENNLSDLGFELDFTDLLREAPPVHPPTSELQEPPEPASADDATTRLERRDSSSSLSHSSAEEWHSACDFCDAPGDFLDAEGARCGACGMDASGAGSSSSRAVLPLLVAPDRDMLPGATEQVNATLRPHTLNSTYVELVPGGIKQDVTEENKCEYVQTLAKFHMFDVFEPAIQAIIEGLDRVVPADLRAEMVQMLSPEALSSIISGLPTIDVEDWEANTEYTHGLSATSVEVQWFWEATRRWDTGEAAGQERLADLLQFVTGSRRVPVGGFSQLQGFNGGRHKFTIAKGKHLTAQSLPTAHACVCTLDLPVYPNLETTINKLETSLAYGTKRFDEAAGAANADD